MATTTRILDANVNGTVYTSNANSALEALDTCHSGATAPTDEVANGKLWLDTSTTPATLKVYDNAAWNIVYSGRGDLDVTGTVTADGLTLGDNDKAIFGAGSDLQIYHSGTHSYIDDGGTGNLYVKATNFRINNAGDTQQMFSADDGGAVMLFNNGGMKLATTSTGINVTGTVTATSFAGDGSSITGVLRKGPDIGAGVDLNTYTTDGYYHQNANSNAGSGTNYPVSLAGMLTVTADGSMVYQKYQTYNGSGTYQRTRYNTTWYDWDKVLDSGNLTTTGTLTATAFVGDGSALTGVGGADLVTDYTLEVLASDTITVPANRTVIVEAVGAGGAGGSASQDDDSSANLGATGGASGGYALKKFTTSGSDVVLTCTVGAGGTGVQASDTTKTGGTGGNTTVTGTGISITAGGGSGGNGRRSTTTAGGTVSGASGGTASGGDINTQGGSTGNITTSSGHGVVAGGGAAVFANAAGSSSGLNKLIAPATGKYMAAQYVGGTATSIVSGSTTVYDITAEAGDIGCGGGGATCMSGDSSTGARRATGGSGGNGFVRIRVLKEL